MTKIVRLTESDLVRIVKRVISEQGGRETFTINQNVQTFYNGKYFDTLYIKTVETAGDTLNIVADAPSSVYNDGKFERKGLKNLKFFYDCKRKRGLEYNQWDDNQFATKIVTLGPKFQKQIDGFCNTAMGIASTGSGTGKDLGIA